MTNELKSKKYTYSASLCPFWLFQAFLRYIYDTLGYFRYQDTYDTYDTYNTYDTYDTYNTCDTYDTTILTKLKILVVVL